MDGWVYLAHGHVFANAQTGNIVLFAIYVAAGEFTQAARVVPSIAAFIAGLLCSRLAGAWLKQAGWNSRSVRLSAECIALLALALVVRHQPNTLVTACVGFIAAVQITTVSHIGPITFNTGMTTGNLRAAISAVSAVLLDPNSVEDRRKMTVLGSLCLAFPAGALLGAFSTRWLGDGTLFIIATLVTCTMLMLRRMPDPLPPLA